MKNLIIIGARGYGREVYNWATQCNQYNSEWTIKGFLDDKKDALDRMNYPVEILSSVENYEIIQDDVFVCALGGVAFKKKYVSLLIDRGAEFINLIHPTAIIHDFVNLGTGVIVCPNSLISNECVIGDFVTIQSYSTIGHDCVVGKWGHLNAYSFMGGYAILEEEVTLHTRATILPGLVVGKGATVGAGSIVIRKVKPGVTVFGNPAKTIDFGSE
jgi:sugar O-acyltransferase (sialic acid O-acetyltransferase NeuD family)